MSADPARRIRRRRELEARAHAPRRNAGHARAWWLLRGEWHGPQAKAAARLADMLAERRR
ncbi:MAG: hypothetical protein ABSC73_09340 [Acidimicrobiales bacterium]